MRQFVYWVPFFFLYSFNDHVCFRLFFPSLNFHFSLLSHLFSLLSKFITERTALGNFLSEAVLGLEASGHLWWWRTGHAKVDLDGVVDEPLGSR